MPTWLKHGLKFLIGGGGIYLLIHSGALNPTLVGKALTESPLFCLAGFLSYALIVVLPAWLRWFLLIRQAGLKPKASQTFSLHMIGIFFNSLIPGGTGGDLIKGFYLYRHHEAKDKSRALTSIVMDRFVGLYALLLVAMIMIALNVSLWKNNPSLAFTCFFYLGVFCTFTVAIGFFFSPFFSSLNRFLGNPKRKKIPGLNILQSLFNSMLIYKKNPSGLLLTVGIGMIVDGGLILMYYFFAQALGVTLALPAHGFVVPTLTMINGIPISPSGLGVGEVAGSFIYKQLGVSQGSEILALVHICVMVMSLFGIPFYFLYRHKTK